MRRGARPIIIAGSIACSLLLAACGGGGEKEGNSIQMKDLEVVDGTATDAMTDLDGVQAEGTAVVAPNGVAGNAANAADRAAPAPKPEAEAADTEVLSDQ